ncbi:MAG: Trk system potassium transporter TrkA [Clostridia bacterium]|nr:Trk system potassium transporter TrkA [Clostridia bacterium]
MNIIVAGCGKIGTAVVSALVSEGHDVTALDVNPEVINEITNVYDVMGMCGNSADCETLEEAGIDSCDIFVAVTGSDELNMLSCFIAKKMGAKHTVARIRNPEYNDRSLSFMRQQLELSMSINPELLMAQELHNLLKIPSAFKVEYFSRRNLEMIEVRLKKDSPLVGKKISKIRDKEKQNFLIGAVLRNNELHIPDGNFELREGDIVSIVASPTDMQKLLKSLDMIKKAVKDVMILGGSKTAFYLAKILSTTGTNVKIIEKNREHCVRLGEILPKTDIIHGDGSHHDVLMEEGIRSIDAFVALTGMDEENILTSLFAGELNVPVVVSKINSDELTKMAEKLGLDSVVSTKTITADLIIRYARALENSSGSSIETLYKFMDGKAEAIEFNVRQGSKIVGRPIKELSFKQGVLIAGIIRERKTAIIPTGDDIVNEGDRVIVLSPAAHRLGDLADILR